MEAAFAAVAGRQRGVRIERGAGKKYRKLRTHTAFGAWWAGLTQRQPRLFVHWQWAHSWRD